MVIGGQAVLLYGIPRLTEDIDITLGVDIDRLDKIKEICRALDLSIPKEIDENFVKKTNVLVCVDTVTGIRVDFIFSFTQYEAEAIYRCKKVRFGKRQVNFASVEDIIIHKLFAGRPRDIEDVEGIMRRNLNGLDLEYIRKSLKIFTNLVDKQDIIQQFESLLKRIKE